MIDVNQNYIW